MGRQPLPVILIDSHFYSNVLFKPFIKYITETQHKYIFVSN